MSIPQIVPTYLDKTRWV